jgi:Ca2+-binding RTX toxin-like protein
MRKLAFISSVVVLTGVLVASVSAGTAGRFVGTAKNDVLKGTSKADMIDGRGGNDTLSGLAGNDVLIGGKGNDKLVGGRGHDKLRCGTGRDTAVADATDTVGNDCEVVRGLPATPPPPPPPPPTPPPPPPPVGPQAKAGHYCGFTNQGKSICFDVTADSTRVANIDTTSDVDCGNVGIRDLGLSFGGSSPIQSDLTFSFTYNGGIRSGDPDLTNITTSYTLSGKFDTAGNATGTLSLSRFSFDYKGTHYDCAAAGYGWQARAGA